MEISTHYFNPRYKIAISFFFNFKAIQYYCIRKTDLSDSLSVNLKFEKLQVFEQIC